MRVSYESAIQSVRTSANDWVRYSEVSGDDGVRQHILRAKQLGDIQLKVQRENGRPVLFIRAKGGM